jgi:hypothetical protein
MVELYCVVLTAEIAVGVQRRNNGLLWPVQRMQDMQTETKEG